RLVFDPPTARLGIMATGKAYLDVRQALEDLGIDEAKAAALGIRLYKVGLSWPLEPEGARAFAAGLEEVLVVEEKRPLIEDQLVKLLYNLEPARRPRIIGKRDEQGIRLMPTEGELSPTGVAGAITQRLTRLLGEMPELRQRMARLESFEHLAAPPSYGMRTPYFCSGCP